MTLFILSFSLFLETLSGCTCPVTKQTNTSKYPWNKRDSEIVIKAQKRCMELYKNSPCAKEVTKLDEIAWRVACGKMVCEI
jgi:hypothetical protein